MQEPIAGAATLEGAAAPVSAVPEEPPFVSAILGDLGFCGHYLHCHRGGRSGRGHILYSLYMAGGTRTQRELGEQFDLKPGSLSELLAKLEAGGLVERTRDERDSRRLVVSLTERGEAEALAERAKRVRFRERCLACLAPEEQERLLGYLDRIKEHWRSLDGTD